VIRQDPRSFEIADPCERGIDRGAPNLPMAVQIPEIIPEDPNVFPQASQDLPGI
jgi:hypothetical protein